MPLLRGTRSVLRAPRRSLILPSAPEIFPLIKVSRTWNTKPPAHVPVNLAHEQAQGLVGFWDFREGGGAIAYDQSGNGNHGTLTNMANNDWTGEGLDFDGVDDRVSCDLQSIETQSPNGDFSIACRFTWRGNAIVNEAILYRSFSEVPPTGWMIYSWDHNTQFRFILQSSIISMGPLSNNITYTAVATRIGSDIEFWVNGISIGTAVNGGDIDNANPLLIGGDSTFRWSNDVHYARIYNRALSPGEIKEIYERPNNIYVPQRVYL